MFSAENMKSPDTENTSCPSNSPAIASGGLTAPSTGNLKTKIY